MTRRSVAKHRRLAARFGPAWRAREDAHVRAVTVRMVALVDAFVQAMRQAGAAAIRAAQAIESWPGRRDPEADDQDPERDGPGPGS